MSSPEQRGRIERVERFDVDTGVDTSNQVKLNLQRVQRILLASLQEIRLRGANSVELFAGLDYLKYHQRLYENCSHALSEIAVPAYHQFDVAYWDIDYTPNTSQLLHTQISPQLEVWSGMLSQFDHGLRALVVDMAMQVYAQELLKTQQIAEALVGEQKIPRGTKRFDQETQKQKSKLEAQLLLAMMHSFRPNYVLAVALAAPEGPKGPKYLAGSIGAAQGKTDRPMGWTTGWDGRKVNDETFLSSLPTNTALEYTLNDVGRAVAHTPENKIVEITRLNVVPKAICTQLGIGNRSELSEALMKIIHLAVDENMDGVELEVFNTQPALHRAILLMGLPARIISEPESVRPTELVAKSIHGAYFLKSPPVPQIMRLNNALLASKKYFNQ